MTFGEFLDYEYGFNLRQANEWELTRSIMWSSLAAMGGKDTPSPEKLFPLWIDKINRQIEKTKEKEYLSDDIVKKWINSIE
jgi:hypothetical protein